VQSNFITQLLNLKGIKVTKISHGNSFVKIYITTEPRKHTCPACGSKTSRIHDYREQTIKDLPLQFKHTYLVLRKRRYVCSCGKRFYESYNFLPRYQRMTNRLAFFVCQELTKLTSLTSVAKSANVSVSTVIRILIILIMVFLHYLRFSVLMNLRVMQRLESINVFLLMAKRTKF